MTEDCAADACATNMGLIHLRAGDLVSAYRYFLPLAEQGGAAAIEQLIDICQRAGDTSRAGIWISRRDSTPRPVIGVTSPSDT